jgi:nucleotide-binding universal stress UspA family protein
MRSATSSNSKRRGTRSAHDFPIATRGKSPARNVATLTTFDAYIFREKENNDPMKTILVPVDFSDATTAVIETARTLAGALGGNIVLLNVAEPEPDFVGFEPGPATVRVAVAHDFKAERQRLDELKGKLADTGREVTALHIQGPIAEKILEEAEQQHADLIVMGSHGHGALYELLVGSITTGVLKNAKCPVVVVPAAKKTA